MKRKFLRTFVLVCTLVALITTSIPVSVFALSNGKNFKNQGKTPLAVTVSYYSDVYSRGVAWTTMEATDGVLEVVPADNKANVDWTNATVIDAHRTVEDSTYYTYTAYVENLTEDYYCYRVGSKDGTCYSDVGTFTVDHDQDEINFIFATDSQDYDEEGFSQWTNLVKAAYETMPEAQFFGMGGDIVNNSHDEDSHDLDQWIYALDLPKDNIMDSVFMPVAGNHDKLEETFCNRFAIDYQGSTLKGGYYSFDYGNAHFVGLNTNESGDALNIQAEWLKQDLASTDKQWKVVMMHKGLISTGDHSEDSDVKKIREVMLPIMAEYEVDMVLQGHDHCYVRSVPYSYGEDANGELYNGKTPNLEETFITEIENGKSITYSVEPNGTFYMTANYAGRKSYPPIDYDEDLIHLALNPYNGLPMSQNVQLQMFTTIKIVKNTLQFNAYTYDNSTGKVSLYDTYNIKKDTHVEVENQVRDLPTLSDADIFDYEQIQIVKNTFEKLPNIAINRFDGELKNKLEQLTSVFSVENCEEAYIVACEIRDLGNVTPDKNFIDKVKSINKKYADLSSEQATFVINYSEVAPKVELYKDMLYANAVSNLAYECSKGENVSAFEVYYAYNQLTDAQKELVDLHGVSAPQEGDEPDSSIDNNENSSKDNAEDSANSCSSSLNVNNSFVLIVLFSCVCLIAKKFFAKEKRNEK